MPEKAPPPGLHRDIPDVEYHQWTGAINQSTLKTLRKYHAQRALGDMNNPFDQTSAQSVGQALHYALMEPEKLEDHVVCGLSLRRAGQANLSKHAAFEEANFGKIILKQKDFDLVYEAAEQIQKYSLAMELLSMQETELSMTWEDEDTSLLCKGRLDKFGMYRKWSSIADVKSTSAEMTDDSLEREMGKWGYDVQDAFYTDGLFTLSPLDRRFFIIFCSSSLPFQCRVVEPDPEAIFQGRIKYKAAIRTWAECEKTGVYPGYPQVITQLGLKTWDRVSERELEEASGGGA
jgi:exodeoxyribonuclease VIII